MFLNIDATQHLQQEPILQRWTISKSLTKKKKKKKRYIFSLDLTTVTGDAHPIAKTAEANIPLFRKHQSEEWSGVAHFNDIECMEADYLPHIQVQDHLRL